MTATSPFAPRLDRLGALLGLAGIAAFAVLPFVVFKANRIASGDARSLFAVLPAGYALTTTAIVALVAATAAGVANARIRLIAALVGVVVVALTLGAAADALTPAGNRIVRVSPGVGFWVLLLVLALVATDALARLRPGPGVRVLCLALTGAVVYAAFAHGTFDNLSIMREYAVNASSFAREARQHVLLALGSLGAAVLVGLPLGILCHRVARIRGAVLQTLNLIQTIPSIALFGILMVPLGALATAMPLAAELGISGIGAAPAVIALFLYALLPVVANTTVGLGRVSPAAVDAARGMGLTDWQVLTQIELILALPVIVTGIRIVLVQNIGLVTIAALIGGGGFGTFVFQGVGQTAIDLVLLGAIPTVALAFASAVVLDALVDAMNRTRP
jgi:osmoprotectant transport system permease protein